MRLLAQFLIAVLAGLALVFTSASVVTPAADAKKDCATKQSAKRAAKKKLARCPSRRSCAKPSLRGKAAAKRKPATKRGKRAAKRRKAASRKSPVRRCPALRRATGKPAAARPETAPPASPGCCALQSPSATTDRAVPQKPNGDLHFAADSVWDARLPANAPVDPRSHARLDSMLDHVEARAADAFFPSLAISSYSTPVYVVPAGQPRVRVKIDSWNPSLEQALADGVPIPAHAKPAAGSDAHLTVYQPSTDSMWEFWKAARRSDGWHASWGGAMRQVSKSPGYYDSRAWPGLKPAEGLNWGSTATSLPVAAGLITIQDLRKGRIDHALAASVPFACRDEFVYPAQRTDGLSVRDDCMPEGARLRLDPDLDIDALGLPKVTATIAKAAQQYGIVVRDKTGGQTISLFAEQVPAGEPNVYLGPEGLLGGVPAWSALRKFPWRKLEMVKARTCQRAPCLPLS